MILKIENDFIGYLETIHFSNDYLSAINALHIAIKGDFNYLLKEYPKAKWNVGYIDEKTETWVNLYSISTNNVMKLIKKGIF